MFTIKRTTLLPINCYYGILVLAKNEAVLILIPRYTVFFGISPNTNAEWDEYNGTACFVIMKFLGRIQ